MSEEIITLKIGDKLQIQDCIYQVSETKKLDARTLQPLCSIKMIDRVQ